MSFLPKLIFCQFIFTKISVFNIVSLLLLRTQTCLLFKNTVKNTGDRVNIDLHRLLRNDDGMHRSGAGELF